MAPYRRPASGRREVFLSLNSVLNLNPGCSHALNLVFPRAYNLGFARAPELVFSCT
ncbi:hypothetical protein CHELA40_14215 [Chelatococcus asaccharovorans]|nr:hypothetical protein CHELA17_61407 [Chelatococcus asaccharovorans]CAH1675978.1 hypothetical protein CHELA40_14215 [Chelatococcus asaccharovorans]